MLRLFPNRQAQPCPAYLVAPDNFIFPLLIQILNFQEISSKNKSKWKKKKKSWKHLQVFRHGAASQNTAEKGTKATVKNMLGFFLAQLQLSL